MIPASLGHAQVKAGRALENYGDTPEQDQLTESSSTRFPLTILECIREDSQHRLYYVRVLRFHVLK